MHDPLPLLLDSKYHMFCFLIIKQSRVCKLSVRFDLQRFPRLPLTDNRNPCNPWTFQLCKNATDTYDFFNFILFFDVYIVI